MWITSTDDNKNPTWTLAVFSATKLNYALCSFNFFYSKQLERLEG